SRMFNQLAALAVSPPPSHIWIRRRTSRSAMTKARMVVAVIHSSDPASGAPEAGVVRARQTRTACVSGITQAIHCPQTGRLSSGKKTPEKRNIQEKTSEK